MLAVVNGRIYTMVGTIIEKGIVLIKAGKIEAVGQHIPIPKDYKIINAEGKHVLPGFIDIHAHLGIFEESVGEIGADANERHDPVSPHLRAIDAINPMDQAFQDALAAGITCIVSSPGSKNVIGGQCVAIKTFGTVIDKMIVKEPAGLKVAFGENPKMAHGGQGKKPSTRMSIAGLIRLAFVESINYRTRTRPNGPLGECVIRDLKLEVFTNVLDHKIPLVAHAHRADDIITAIRIANEFNLQLIIIHGTEGRFVTAELVESNIPVVVGPLLGSRSKVELGGLDPKTAGILANRGVKTALTTDHPIVPIQYLPLCAALAVKEGMKEEDALAAITRNAAEIIGIEDRVGSLVAGKDGDVVVWDGHPLDIRSAPSKVIVNGKVVYMQSDS
mgnify:CR=1 FL=1